MPLSPSQPASPGGPGSPLERLFPDAETLAAVLAGEVAARLRAAIAARGQASLVVSGGRSPIAFFRALSAQTLEWQSLWITLADERWVDPSAPDSNERLVREHLRTGAAAAAHWVPLKTPAASAAKALNERSLAVAAMPRPFDVTVLGMGDDGHTASLFPRMAGPEAAQERSQGNAGSDLLAAVDTPKLPNVQCPRITLSLPALLASRRIYLVIGGATKWQVYRRAAAGASPLELPVAAILGQREVPVEVYWAG